MNQEWKAKWVEALRSGAYPQARKRLRTTQGFCCVLCDIVDNTKWEMDEGEGLYGGVATTAPPVYAMNLVELTQIQASELAQQNDAGRTFEQIADYIENRM